MKKLIITFLMLSFCFIAPCSGSEFRLVSYNAENLFDCYTSGHEYKEYIPEGEFGWNCEMFKKKISNISKVLTAIDGDIVALEEVESKASLDALKISLKKEGLFYRYSAIEDKTDTTVKCAILSKFPIKNIKEIKVAHKWLRPILRADLDINGRSLIVYVNHWKSKRGPESERIISAEALRADALKLAGDSDYIFTGDFNSDYREDKTIKSDRKHNDSGGITGIDHILSTIISGHSVNKKDIVSNTKTRLHYNLWNDLPEYKRWSYNFYGKKTAIDSIIVSIGLFDNKGISYVDSSFRKYTPSWLFKKRAVYRWQIDKRKKKHLGEGFSDHLPVYADFKIN